MTAGLRAHNLRCEVGRKDASEKDEAINGINIIQAESHICRVTGFAEIDMLACIACFCFILQSKPNFTRLPIRDAVPRKGEPRASLQNLLFGK